MFKCLINKLMKVKIETIMLMLRSRVWKKISKNFSNKSVLCKIN